METIIEQKQGSLPKTGIWWACLDFARSPFYYVVFIYIFATYFAEVVIADSAQGQTIFSSTITISGLIMAVFAPFLGGYLDRGGLKKPLLLGVIVVLAACSAGLSLVQSGSAIAVPLGMTLLVIAGCCYGFSELLHNYLLPASGNKKQVPLISGLGLSMGAFAAVAVLLLILYFLKHPPFGFSQTDIARLSGVFCAAWMLIMIVPFYIGCPDLVQKNATWRTAKFFSKNWTPVKAVKGLFNEHSLIMRFLVARMIFMDGLTALYTIGAVYVAGVFGWTTSEVATMGILATCSAILGGVAGGFLDNRFSPRNAILIELGAITAIFCFQLSLSPDAILFGLIDISHHVSDRSIFTGLADLIYLATIIPLSAFIIAAYSSCRSLLVALSPPQELGRFFGIYAMTNTVTIWVGPALVTGITFISGNQKLGFASLLILFITGFLAMTKIKTADIKHLKAQTQGIESDQTI